MDYEDNQPSHPATCELHANKNGLIVHVQGTESDSLSDVVNAAHSELRWMWDRDEMAMIDDQRPKILTARSDNGD